jgi:hypothetical protein
MSLTDYLIPALKKPELNSTESSSESLKEQVRNQIEFCYSRMESIEILNSNSKTPDVKILAEGLVLDILHIAEIYFSLPKTTKLAEYTNSISKISAPEIVTELENLISVQKSLEKNEFSDDDAEEAETKIGKVLYKLESIINKKAKNEHSTAMDSFKLRLKIQITSVLGIVLIAVGAFVFKKIKYPDLKEGQFEIFALEETLTPPSQENRLALPLNLSRNWEIYTFESTESLSFSSLRIDPVDQAKMKFQVSDIKLYDSKGNVVKTTDFRLNENMVQDDPKKIGPIDNVVPGKSKPNDYAELVSMTADPYFHWECGKVKDIKKIEIRTRVVESHKSYKD